MPGMCWILFAVALNLLHLPDKPARGRTRIPELGTTDANFHNMFLQLLASVNRNQHERWIQMVSSKPEAPAKDPRRRADAKCPSLANVLAETVRG
jgi:hypothetical protein